MMRLYNRALSLAYKKLIEHEDIVANHRAKERYQYFVDTYRDLVDVVSKKDIASYLHLSPESLSHVLKSYKEENRKTNRKVMRAERKNLIKSRKYPVFIEESNKQ